MPFPVHALQIVGSEITTGEAAGTVVVVPSLTNHLQRNQQATGCPRQSSDEMGLFQPFLKEIYEEAYAQSNPDGKGIERAGIGIVALARLERSLIEIDHNGQSGHHKQQHDYPQLAPALASVAPLPCDTRQTKQQGQGIEHVAPFVLCQVSRQFRGVAAQQQVVNPTESRYPVAVFHLAVALNVVLPTHEIP